MKIPLIPGSLQYRIRKAVPNDVTSLTLTHVDKSVIPDGNGSSKYANVSVERVGIQFSGRRKTGESFTGEKIAIHPFDSANLYVNDIINTLRDHYSTVIGASNIQINRNPDRGLMELLSLMYSYPVANLSPETQSPIYH
jgi:hypothetical protein|tara:strand:+ start:134 stop:550 length:417 start_codon:yes stop_codon:yes gene_type:complete